MLNQGLKLELDESKPALKQCVLTVVLKVWTLLLIFNFLYKSLLFKSENFR